MRCLACTFRPFGGLLLALAAAACQMTPPANVSFNTYRVSGDSISSLNQQLALHGPTIPGQGKALAAADISFDPTVLLESGGYGCRVARVDFQVNAEVTLPEWLQKDRASPELAALWDAFSEEALEHELVHVRIAEEHAVKMERTIRRLADPDCSKLEAQIREVIDRVAQEHAEAQDKFDEREEARYASINRRRSRGSDHWP